MHVRIYPVLVFLLIGIVCTGCTQIQETSQQQVISPIEKSNDPKPKHTPNPQNATSSGTKKSPVKRTEADLAPIDSITIHVPTPPATDLVIDVKGKLPNPCTELGESKTIKTDNVFEITLPISQPPDILCAQVLKPFEKSITQKVTNLKKGIYTVGVNGVIETFEIKDDHNAKN